jgi:hypothetical protein
MDYDIFVYLFIKFGLQYLQRDGGAGFCIGKNVMV